MSVDADQTEKNGVICRYEQRGNAGYEAFDKPGHPPDQSGWLS